MRARRLRPGQSVLQRTCAKRSACASNPSACPQELHAPNTSRARHADFWVTQTTFLARLRRSPLITVAAIRGACPAGGCCMALWCAAALLKMTCFDRCSLSQACTTRS